MIDEFAKEYLHSDLTGHVPCWARPNVKLFTILVRVLTETSRHAGHADILREQLDGATGPTNTQGDPALRAADRARIERAARAAAGTKP